MIRNLLASTAVAAALIATGAFAQETTAPAPAETAPMTQDAAPVVKAEGNLATKIIGETVYNGTGDDAENIGEVTDFVIGPDGNIQLVVVGVGGFLGLGQKNVAMEYANLEWVERDGDRWLVAPMTKEQLEQQAEFDTRPYEPTPAQTTAANDPALSPTPVAPAPDTTAQAPVVDPAAPAPDASTDQTTTAAIDRSTLTEMPADQIRAEEMIGTTVYGANDANVGEIGDVVLSADGKVDAYIVDVGGFLGMGEKEVAIGSDNLAFMTDADGNKYLYTTFTKEQLEAAATYDKSTFTEKRDDQRLIVQ
ncbi:PRC-barrel domain-containing protein [Mesorhizobium sp. VNQ89]|uniref:PRC-barrel domain-containing protein n=1 Tax=Mesorhizobium quangtriensis TaxID=3157709 RepID=UPI0032B82C85